MSKEIIFWGATGQAKVLREFLYKEGYKLAAVFDNNKLVQPPFPDVPLYYGETGFQHWLSEKPAGKTYGFLVAIGGHRGDDRVRIQNQLESCGLVPITATHQTAILSDSCTIGAGSQILAGSLICVQARLGKSCIVNTRGIVNHECRIGDGVHIGSGANIAAIVEIDDYATIYTSAVVFPRIKIGKRAIIGAGAVVVKDVPANAVVFGNPARIVRMIDDTERSAAGV